jgi:hypothetical protein
LRKVSCRFCARSAAIVFIPQFVLLFVLLFIEPDAGPLTEHDPVAGFP